MEALMKLDKVSYAKQIVNKERYKMLHAGILMSVMLPGMVIVGQIGLLITELMEERMHAREAVLVKVKAHG